MEDNTRQEAREPESVQEALAPELAGLRQARIAALAYSYAERRGFSGHHELDDWLRAEHEVDSAEEALLVK
jgi:hypothetical protein